MTDDQLFATWISIHAPVKGATTPCGTVRSQPRISIHAPVKGATQTALRSAVCLWNFNPRSREGSDQGRSDGRG